MRADRNLPERIIGFRERPFLLNPVCLAFACHHRNLPVPAGSLDDRGNAPKKVFLFQRFHQRTLKLIRHQIAALRVCPHLQGILHVIEILSPHGIPESLPVLIRCPALLLLPVRVTVGFIGDGHGSRPVQLRINRSLPLQPLNLLPQIHHIRLHLVIRSRILCGHHAVRPSLTLQKGFRRLPRLRSLFP